MAPYWYGGTSRLSDSAIRAIVPRIVHPWVNYPVAHPALDSTRSPVTFQHQPAAFSRNCRCLPSPPRVLHADHRPAAATAAPAVQRWPPRPVHHAGRRRRPGPRSVPGAERRSGRVRPLRPPVPGPGWARASDWSPRPRSSWRRSESSFSAAGVKLHRPPRNRRAPCHRTSAGCPPRSGSIGSTAE